MSKIALSKLIPKSIIGYWLENEDFLSDYVLIESWTPFEAACLINGINPGDIAKGVVRVGLVPTTLDKYDESPQSWTDESALITLTGVILRNNNNRSSVSSEDIIKWAVETGQLHSKSYLAKILIVDPNENSNQLIDASPTAEDLQRQLNEANCKTKLAEKQIDLLQTELTQAKKNLKMTGKFHNEKRLVILGAALNEIAAECPNELFTTNGRLVAVKLAKHLDDNRNLYNVPLEYGFSYENILASIRDAVSSAVKSQSIIKCTSSYLI